MIWSPTRSSSLRRTAESSNARACPLRTPWTSSSEDAEVLARLARGEHDSDRLGQQAPGNETRSMRAVA
jgi:hypothetical protein